MGCHPILLYIPNLIGYLRIATCIAAFQFCFTDVNVTVACYILSQGLDAVDGVAARYFGQSSKFGAVLDMLTDRMTTLCLCLVLSHLYVSMWGFFMFLIVLDVTSHWFQMYTKLSQGAVSHKGSGTSPVLAFYYSFPFLLIFCCLNEVFLVALYVRSHVEQLDWAATPIGGMMLVDLTLYTCLPFFLFKQFANVIQLADAVGGLLALDDHEKAQKAQ